MGINSNIIPQKIDLSKSVDGDTILWDADNKMLYANVRGILYGKLPSLIEYSNTTSGSVNVYDENLAPVFGVSNGSGTADNSLGSYLTNGLSKGYFGAYSGNYGSSWWRVTFDGLDVKHAMKGFVLYKQSSNSGTGSIIVDVYDAGGSSVRVLDKQLNSYHGGQAYSVLPFDVPAGTVKVVVYFSAGGSYSNVAVYEIEII